MVKEAGLKTTREEEEELEVMKRYVCVCSGSISVQDKLSSKSLKPVVNIALKLLHGTLLSLRDMARVLIMIAIVHNWPIIM